MAGGFVRVDAASTRDIARLFRDLRKAEPQVAKDTRAKFKKAAQPTLEDAIQRQPKDTGELRRKTKIYVRRGQVQIRSRARHARTSEFGGRVQLWGRDKWVPYKAQPALMPAAVAHRKEFINAANRAVIDAFRKVGN